MAQIQLGTNKSSEGARAPIQIPPSPSQVSSAGQDAFKQLVDTGKIPQNAVLHSYDEATRMVSYEVPGIGVVRRGGAGGPHETWHTVEKLPENAVQLSTGEYVKQEEFAKLSQPEQAYLKAYGIDKFNAEQERVRGQKVAAYEAAQAYGIREQTKQAQWVKDNLVEVGPDKDLIFKTTFSNLTPTDQAALKQLGIAGFNAKQQSVTPSAPAAAVSPKYTAANQNPNVDEAVENHHWVGGKELIRDPATGNWREATAAEYSPPPSTVLKELQSNPANNIPEGAKVKTYDLKTGQLTYSLPNPVVMPPGFVGPLTSNQIRWEDFKANPANKIPAKAEFSSYDVNTGTVNYTTPFTLDPKIASQVRVDIQSELTNPASHGMSGKVSAVNNAIQTVQGRFDTSKINAELKWIGGAAGKSYVVDKVTGNPLTDQEIALRQWNNLTEDQKQQVMALYSQDLFKGNYGAENYKLMADMAQQAGIVGGIAFGIPLAIGGPIAKATTGQKVTPLEVAVSAATLATLALPFVSAPVGTLLGGGAGAVFTAQTIHDWKTMTTPYRVLSVIGDAAFLIPFGAAAVKEAVNMPKMTQLTILADDAGRAAKTMNATIARMDAIGMGSEEYAQAASNAQKAIQASRLADQSFLNALSRVNSVNEGQLRAFETNSGYAGLTQAVKDIGTAQKALSTAWKTADALYMGTQSWNDRIYLGALKSAQLAKTNLEASLLKFADIAQVRPAVGEALSYVPQAGYTPTVAMADYMKFVGQKQAELVKITDQIESSGAYQRAMDRFMSGQSATMGDKAVLADYAQAVNDLTYYNNMIDYAKAMAQHGIEPPNISAYRMTLEKPGPTPTELMEQGYKTTPEQRAYLEQLAADSKAKYEATLKGEPAPAGTPTGPTNQLIQDVQDFVNKTGKYAEMKTEAGGVAVAEAAPSQARLFAPEMDVVLTPQYGRVASVPLSIAIAPTLRTVGDVMIGAAALRTLATPVVTIQTPVTTVTVPVTVVTGSTVADLTAKYGNQVAVTPGVLVKPVLTEEQAFSNWLVGAPQPKVIEWMTPQQAIERAQRVTTEALTQSIVETTRELQQRLAAMGATQNEIVTATDNVTKNMLQNITDTQLRNAVHQQIEQQTKTVTEQQLQTQLQQELQQQTETQTKTQTAQQTVTQVTTEITTPTTTVTPPIPPFGGKMAVTEEGRPIHPDGTVVWKMGVVWKSIPPPYDLKKPLSSRKAPAGVTILKGTPQETLTFIGGVVPFTNIAFDLGVVDGFIDVKAKRIVFTGYGTRTKVGRTLPEPTRGITLGGEEVPRPQGRPPLSVAEWLFGVQTVPRKRTRPSRPAASELGSVKL